LQRPSIPEKGNIPFAGSFLYIAPEMLEANGTGYSSNADVWSLGICALEFAEGEAPNSNVPFLKVVFQIIQKPSPTAKQERKLSPEFKHFIASCLVKDPHRRPGARSLLGHKFLAGSPTCAIALQDLTNQALKTVEGAGGLGNAIALVNNTNQSSTRSKDTTDSNIDSNLSLGSELSEPAQSDSNLPGEHQSLPLPTSSVNPSPPSPHENHGRNGMNSTNTLLSERPIDHSHLRKVHSEILTDNHSPKERKSILKWLWKRKASTSLVTKREKNKIVSAIFANDDTD